MTPAVIEQEFFTDNSKMLKQENRKIETARKAEEEATELLEQVAPKLEATVESLSTVDELTVETVLEGLV